MAGVRRWGREQVLRELVGQYGLEPGGSISGGEIAYVNGGLRRRLAVHPGKHDRDVLHWQVDIGDERCRNAKTMAFWIRVGVRDELVGKQVPVSLGRNWSGYRWPKSDEGLPVELVHDLRRFGAAMLNFARDRSDLGRLLLAEDGPVYRGDVFGQRWPGGPAGLVQAVVLGRDIPDRELESVALATLERNADRDVPGFGGRFPAAVAYWARQHAALLDVNIDDLCRLDGRGQRR